MRDQPCGPCIARRRPSGAPRPLLLTHCHSCCVSGSGSGGVPGVRGALQLSESGSGGGSGSERGTAAEWVCVLTIYPLTDPQYTQSYPLTLVYPVIPTDPRTLTLVLTVNLLTDPQYTQSHPLTDPRTPSHTH